jgi:uncharacterized damage-inducible protein DinB
MDDLLRDLLTYSAWANAVFFHAWGKSPARDHEEMRTRVGHIVGVQKAFLSILRGDQPQIPTDGPAATFEELKAGAEISHAGLLDALALYDSVSLTRLIKIPWIYDPPLIPVYEALIQVVLHTQHHRGQCMTRLRDFGGQPKTVDWISWLLRVKPAARWE